MSLQEKKIIDSILITKNKCLIINEVFIITKDDSELMRTEKKFYLTPNADLTNQDQLVVDIANLLWTEEVKKEFLDSLKINSDLYPSNQQTTDLTGSI